MPSLALVFHLLHKVEGWQGDEVSLDAARDAATWCEFLEQQARKVYAGILNKNLQAAHALQGKIEDGTIVHGQTVRAIYRNQWSFLRSPEDVFGGLALLEQHGWVRVKADSSRGGRPTDIIEINPAINPHP
jgi:hypothetical protein